MLESSTGSYSGLNCLFMMISIIVFGCGAPVSNTPSPDRNPDWARAIDRPGLLNLHLVDEGLYRGAQPDPEGFSQLREMGIRTIINLRSIHTDAEEIEDAGLDAETFNHVTIPMDAWHVDEDDVVAFLKIAVNADNRPLFFHCQAGADRTGTMAAAYRVVVQGWSVDAAIEEMTDGGYGYHEVWFNLIEFLRSMDVEAIRKKTGISN